MTVKMRKKVLKIDSLIFLSFFVSVLLQNKFILFVPGSKWLKGAFLSAMNFTENFSSIPFHVYNVLL